MKDLEKFFDEVLDFTKVLSDENRLKIIIMLSEGDFSSKEIQNHLDKSQPRVSQHLNKLIEVGIVGSERETRRKKYFIKDPRVFTILNNIVDFINPKEKEKVDLLL